MAHGVPSGLKHPGGGGSAEASGAATIAEAAAPARRTVLKDIFFSAMRGNYPHCKDLETDNRFAL
jgi:hypothetical protein